MKRRVVLSNWRDDLSEYVDITNVSPKKSKTDTKARKKVDGKGVNNKVVINPTMAEAFEELGGTVISIDEEKLSKEEMEELQRKKDKKEGRKPGKVEEGSNPAGQLADIDKRIAMQRLKRARVEKQQAKKNQGQDTEMNEKIDIEKADMGDVVKDFYKSDAPQFKGKSKEKKREMAIAAKLSTEETETVTERTRYAKETGKDFTTGKPSEKGGTRSGDSAYDKVRASMKKTGGLMSDRGKAIQPQGKKKEKGAKGYQGVTPVDKIKAKLSKKRAPKPRIGSRFD